MSLGENIKDAIRTFCACIWNRHLPFLIKFYMQVFITATFSLMTAALRSCANILGKLMRFLRYECTALLGIVRRTLLDKDLTFVRSGGSGDLTNQYLVPRRGIFHRGGQ